MTDEGSSTYLLDTNVFIEAYRRYYAMDLCPGFWQSLEHYCQEGRLLTIDRVRDEIAEGDELAEWIRQAPSELFASTSDELVVYAFRDMMAWVQGNGQFRKDAKDEFARVADGWLVAYAAVHGCVVVTHEQASPEAKKWVPIPSVCGQYDVIFCSTFSMLRDLGIRFDWT